MGVQLKRVVTPLKVVRHCTPANMRTSKHSCDVFALVCISGDASSVSLSRFLSLSSVLAPLFLSVLFYLRLFISTSKKILNFSHFTHLFIFDNLVSNKMMHPVFILLTGEVQNKSCNEYFDVKVHD